jgi:hypothetical protein
MSQGNEEAKMADAIPRTKGFPGLPNIMAVMAMTRMITQG